MKNKVLGSMALVGLFFMLAVANAQAQTPRQVEINVPFAFSAGKAKLEAGSYTLRKLSDRALVLRSNDGKRSVLINAPLTGTMARSKRSSSVVFNRYGNEYFLSQVWLTVDHGRQLFPTRAEEESARQLGKLKIKPQRLEIAALAR